MASAKQAAGVVSYAVKAKHPRYPITRALAKMETEEDSGDVAPLKERAERKKNLLLSLVPSMIIKGM